jgi:hypothetical protein
LGGSVELPDCCCCFAAASASAFCAASISASLICPSRFSQRLRGYVYDFIEIFAPHLTHRVVTAALKEKERVSL